MRVSKRVKDADLDRSRLIERCAVCRIPQVRTIPFRDERYCAPCAISEVNLGDVDSLDSVLPFIKEHRICAYCGEYGEEIEHVIPRWTHLPTWTVPACRECNGLANGYVPSGFADKRQYIRARMRKKYARALALPEWTEDEISQLGDSLARHIRACAGLRDWILARLEFEVAVEEVIEASLAKQRDRGIAIA